MKKKKQKLLNSCLAVAVALSATLAPGVANAATPDAVTRIGGYDQYATAALMAQKGWTGTSDSVVLSAGMTYSLVDALAAGPLAAKLKAPILLTDNGTTLNASAKAQLLRLKPTKVYITSGTAVIRQSVLDEIRAMGITPVELGGYDQYETSVNIAKEMANQGVNISKVVVAAGWLSPADALSIAPIAAAQGMPILTTTQGQLPASVKTYLDGIDDNVKNSYVVGGAAVVSDAVKGALPGKVSRHAGQTKYDTNVEILKSFAKHYKNDKVYVANGETLVDALSVVPLAAASGSPVVLVNQELGNATRDFVKLNMSTDDMVAVGGEVVVPSAGMSALTSAVAYSIDSETVGSTDKTTPMVLTDNVQLTGDNITLQNAQANYSVYVKGDNITLNNLTVKGTVFVDPGETGSATLDGVTAANIVVLSGASDSIHIKNTTAGVLTVDSSSNVRVEATGTTSIGDTVVRTFAIIDANGGSMGTVTITSTPGQDPVVELRGTFTEPVVVEGQVSLQAAAGAVVPSVIIKTENADQKVTLSGSFKAVEVQSQGKLALADNTVVETMKTTAKVDITIPSGSSIGSLDSGSTGTLVSGGGKVNGKNTSSTPSAPPSTGTGGSSGGGSGGGNSGGGDTPAAKAKVTSLTGATISGTQISISPSADVFKQPNIKVDQNATMKLSVVRSGSEYNLGSWALTNSSSGNDIFSVSNASNLNVLSTLTILRDTGIQSSEIFDAIDFHAVLTAAQGMTEANKNKVYDSIAAIFSQASGTSSSTAFYQALNLPGIYAAADTSTKNAIEDIVDAAIPAGVTVSASHLLGSSSAQAVANITQAGKMNLFVSGIDFQELFDELSTSPQKEAIFTAINFTAMYNAIEALPSGNKLQVYINMANIYQAALTVDTTDGINFGALIQLMITDQNVVKLTLTNSNGTTTYTVVKGS
ncbi:cell wall-binding repeat-containing protein [Desulfosporosinus youngiae]|uniref:Cell wall-binding protein n=1 Tax=Desulfosporosinus youngiae DSM 17734 TaxID=768710 RepID=H5XZH1_9FIRM|nr:cell wall-binding repeat-containing protein [Desulfosporosinus youngiae]EHQ91877.1 cell wall-binding protein [Desulfosporosinus youngiae DSM 17734]